VAEALPFYEGFLSRHFPAWGSSRAAARQLASSRNIRASVNEGIASRVSESFTSRLPLSFQSQADRWKLGWMRNRARQAYRGNPIARGLVNTEVDNVVSHGMTLQAQTDSEEFNDEAEEKFEEWLQTADLRGMLDGAGLQRMAWKESRVDGDGGFVLVSSGGDSKLQYIKGDLICTPDGKSGINGFYDGVECDSFGRPIAFHILTQDEYGKRAWQRVAAQDFVYFNNPSEAYDVRGTTCYATIFDQLNNLEQYIDGVALAAWMATVFGIIIKEDTAVGQVRGLGAVTNSQGNQQKAITFENGSVKFMGEKGQVMQVDAKQPLQQTPDFVRMMLRLIGVPFDMPLEVVLKDVSQSNLSSLRGAITDFRRSCKVKQRRYSGTREWGKIYRWWISREVKMGTFTSAVPEKFFDHEWMFHGWQFTNPVEDVQAALLEVDAGFNTRRNIMEGLGRDPDAINMQLSIERADAKAMELPDVASNMTRDRVDPAETPEPQPALPAGDNNNAE
jgi:lambda family phage portal protein